MDNFGDLFGGLGDIIGEMLGDRVEEAGAGGMGALLGSGERQDEQAVPIVYERYLCGGPRELNVNDR